MLIADATSGGFIALWTVIYVVPVVTLGFCSIRKDRWIMFIFGLFIALFWFIGALLPDGADRRLPRGDLR